MRQGLAACMNRVNGPSDQGNEKGKAKKEKGTGETRDARQETRDKGKRTEERGGNSGGESLS